ncbi:hypothetical protein D3M59_10720 [Sphingomonas edaphi]|uniref:Uncharacterized protein n=1 Tax=Sphingomonas edaphi TaxID=2315689 RepID=A0A418PYD2_9SPHN|nr:hypothetical protein D3M59_10720 [Sphingomonas edaphi]
MFGIIGSETVAGRIFDGLRRLEYCGDGSASDCMMLRGGLQLSSADRDRDKIKLSLPTRVTAE